MRLYKTEWGKNPAQTTAGEKGSSVCVSWVLKAGGVQVKQSVVSAAAREEDPWTDSIRGQNSDVCSV